MRLNQGDPPLKCLNTREFVEVTSRVVKSANKSEEKQSKIDLYIIGQKACTIALNVMQWNETVHSRASGA